ncbi:hypothetical protein Btru_032576 [Bulinus truncatus]|nr:hypothetical protein Btru_032576 [Bulinus truncatus]
MNVKAEAEISIERAREACCTGGGPEAFWAPTCVPRRAKSYHEEILERSPRREFLNNYSRQLLLRYPNMMEPISSRMSRLNSQWAELEHAIAPKHSTHDAGTMLQDLECDLESLRRWLVATETRLLSLTIKADWSTKELEERLLQHQPVVFSHPLCGAKTRVKITCEDEKNHRSNPLYLWVTRSGPYLRVAECTFIERR